jgi:hypothetical protein
MLFNLMSVLIPNFAYMEVAGVQPMPTRTSPVFFPQITANDTRNGVAKGTSLLGSTYWTKKNEYTSNRMNEDTLTFTNGSTAVTGQASFLPLLAGKVELYLTISSTDYYLIDDGAGGFTQAAGAALPAAISAASVDYTTGEVSVTLASTATVPGDEGYMDYRYDLNNYDPAQALFEWSSLPLVAEPRRLRSKYSLGNFYEAKKVLDGYDIDQIMSQTVAGYINKEISCGVFDNMLDQADATYTWDEKLPSGVSWAWHRLELIKVLVEASNAIRGNIARSSGNVIVADTTMMNTIETFDGDVWNPARTGGDEPIGPYVAGELQGGRFKVVKNQDYTAGSSMMAYKKDETDSSYAVGVFIGLYSTEPIALDDLKVIQGMGTQIAEKKIFDNSIVEISIVDTTS